MNHANEHDAMSTSSLSYVKNHNYYSLSSGYRAPGNRSRLGYVRMVYHLSLCLITFGYRLAHLVYCVHKSGNILTFLRILVQELTSHLVTAV